MKISSDDSQPNVRHHAGKVLTVATADMAHTRNGLPKAAGLQPLHDLSETSEDTGCHVCSPVKLSRSTRSTWNRLTPKFFWARRRHGEAVRGPDTQPVEVGFGTYVSEAPEGVWCTGKRG